VRQDDLQVLVVEPVAAALHTSPDLFSGLEDVAKAFAVVSHSGMAS